MQEGWRWFGPQDPVRLEAVRQTGAKAIVSALHHIPTGDVWPRAQIAARQALIAGPEGGPTGLHWGVVESLPVSEDIKRQTGDWRAHIANWIQSLHHLADAGLKVICYNFMPVLDWTRTHIDYALADGSSCMRFDLVDFAAYDLFILRRPDADFAPELMQAAQARFTDMPDARRSELARTVGYGLPGAAEALTVDGVRDCLSLYRGIDAQRLRAHLVDFLEQVAPVAQELGLRLCCHPDDPPFPLLGLPRVMSTEADYAAILDAVDLPANGVTLCSGSLGARPDNDLPGMMARLGDRVHFLHLRNVRREGRGWPVSFYESGHLDGDVDMVALLGAVLQQEARRRALGRSDDNIPFRPDHGLHMTDDRSRGGQPGYPLVGRHVGLAELRGAIAVLSRAGALA
ncbi:MAG: mannonate dehydratase [Rhodobacteraceae bacterium]|nr:mannonate dehydratase [Paracoccaceae bacterium]